MKVYISPSILSANIANLASDLAECEAGGADNIHIDVMDGRFVPNITFGPLVVSACKQITKLPLCVHLMIVEPEKHLEAFTKAGADRITVHYETCPHIHRTLQTIRELGVKAGVTINPGTPVEVLADLIGMFDLALIMSVNPGFGGQAFISRSIQRIEQLKWMLEEEGSKAIIQVDGGVDAKTIGDVYAAGARDFVAGTAIFKHPLGIRAGITALREALPF